MGNSESAWNASVAPAPPTPASSAASSGFTLVETIDCTPFGNSSEIGAAASYRRSPPSSRVGYASHHKLRPCLFGSHAANLKGEDGLRVDRLLIGSDIVTAALVADGHGGHQAAAVVIDEMFTVVAKHARGDGSSEALQAAARHAFRILHERMQTRGFGSTAGTTVTLCLVNETRGELTCCSVGDSFAVLVTPPFNHGSPGQKLHTTELTLNQRIDDNEAERERVRSAGGMIGKAASPEGYPYGPLRAWPGGITCASSLGDADCGAHRPFCPSVDLAEGKTPHARAPRVIHLLTPLPPSPSCRRPKQPI